MPIIKVFNVFIDTDIIVGIGPLLRIQRNDIHAAAYNELTFRFDLYTKYYTISVTTDLLAFPGKGSSTHTDSVNEYSRIRSAWELLCHNMKERIPLDLGWHDLEKDTETPPPDSL